VRPDCKVLAEDTRSDHFSRGSTAESLYWLVLHRPSEPARVAGHLDFVAGCAANSAPDKAQKSRKVIRLKTQKTNRPDKFNLIPKPLVESPDLPSSTTQLFDLLEVARFQFTNCSRFVVRSLHVGNFSASCRA